MPVSVLDVADWFLALADEDGQQLEHGQLQRLCCYAQGFALVLYGDPLFANPIEETTEGPVVRELAERCGGCDGPIPLDALGPIRPILVPSQGIESAVRFVYERFGARSASDLAALATAEPPWRMANCRADHSPFNYSTMHQFFRAEFEAVEREDEAPEVTREQVLDALANDEQLRASIERGRADIAAGRTRRIVRR